MEKTISKSLLEKDLDKILCYLKPLVAFSNCHMVEFITKNLWDTYIPPAIREEISKHADEAHSILSNDNFAENPRLPALCKFLKDTQSVTLKNLQIDIEFDDLCRQLRARGCKQPAKFNLKCFMPQKKMYEVNKMAELIAILVNDQEISHCVDLGDGKGYLGSLLALHYKIPVLGVDSSSINTFSSSNRLKKMLRLWPGIQKKNNPVFVDEELATPPPKEDKNLYKQTTTFVTETTPIETVLKEHFPSEGYKKNCLIGLHTCGNLASTSLQLFNNNNSMKILCNIGCCYHLIEEEFAPSSIEFHQNVKMTKAFTQNAFSVCGFPMSKFLKLKKYKLGRNARMLASQSIERVTNGHETPIRTLFFRALLQVYLSNKYDGKIPNGQVGRKGAKCTTFHEYIQFATNKMNINLDVEEQEAEMLFNKYQEWERKLQLFYLIRMRLSSVIESLILVDRLLFLKENGHNNSYIVKMFEPVVSPRCYGILAFKN